MKHCTKCGMEYLDSVSYCLECGIALAGAYEGAAEAESVRAERVQGENQRAFSGGGVGAAAMNAAIPRKIENHLVKSIIANACCCMPFGIVAVVYAAKVNPYLAANNLNAAYEASQKANLWSNLAIGVGILIQVLWVTFYLGIIRKHFDEFMPMLGS